MKDTQQTSLSGQYGDGLAELYDKNRINTDRHIQEEKTFRRYMDVVSPSSVLDCPVGTCRWFDIYVEGQVELTGVDLSEQMLGQAEAKNKGGLLPKMSLIKGNILEDAFVELLDVRFDSVVCIRFLNWVPLDAAELFIRKIAPLSRGYLIIGITLIPASWGFLKKVLSGIRLARSNERSRKVGRANRYNHPEEFIESLFKDLNLSVVEKSETYQSKEAINYIYLLKKHPDTLDIGK